MAARDRKLIFLSYSRADEALLERLAEDLGSRGERVWWDRLLEPGDDWRVVTTQALAEAKALIVILSPTSLTSRFIREEWATAMAGSKRVIPVLTNGVRPHDLPDGLAQVHAINVDEGYGAAIDQIASAVRRLERSAAPPIADEIDLEAIVDQVAGRVMERLAIDRSSIAGSNEPVDKSLVFVITSFEPDMEPAFDAISAAAVAAGLRAERVKDMPGDYRITDKILAGIRQARIGRSGPDP